ncbi:alpha/beta hydrolase [Streptomyces sp. NBC_01619]|uniref:alpha/beta hydrolase n=1 Tax=Streptomyces sp. NBC_01619 TaxID=2975901 RepID=UPI002257EE9B|nr:alpha/beta hydrolase [Streptomyces sp. NBC_01619]MCX4515131.1 alpha/beta hydrolase [Streptomyces sp. NBC_01619]
MDEITFTSGNHQCSAWHLPATSDAFAGAGGRPCVIMAPGFGGTRDDGLLGYAKGFAAAGIDALLFDYRGFGASGGSPRQLVSVRRQRQDYHAALAAARRLPGVDPERIVLWGVSYAGGHVLAVTAQDKRVAATISVTPAMDGIAVLAQLARNGGLGYLVRATVNGLRDASRALTGRRPHLVPMIGEPGSNAIIPRQGGLEEYRALAGPTWRNEVCARAALEAGFNRPISSASRVTCPWLVQVGINDTIAPPHSGRRAVTKAGARAELREYPWDHLDVYVGPGQAQALADQLDFLRRAL